MAVNHALTCLRTSGNSCNRQVPLKFPQLLNKTVAIDVPGIFH